MKPLIISNMDFGDETFASDVGTWNVTRAKRDCAAGLYRAYTFDVAEALPNNENIEVDLHKVTAMVADRERLFEAPPLIFAMEDGKIWLIDGHHRLRALARLGEPQFLAFVIEEADTKPYRVYFNGNRVAPWMRIIP
jgi:ParB-like nuclease domain